MRWTSPKDQSPDITAEKVSIEGDGALAVHWSDGHLSRFDPAALIREGCADGSQSRSITHWGAELTDTLPVINYADALAGGEGLYHLLEGLRRYGIVKVSATPPSKDSLPDLAEQIGPIRITNYGRVQDLISKADPAVAGQTARAQDPHTDEPFRYTPPAYIFFHALKTGAAGGGTSIMVDGFQIAEIIRRDHPEAFQLLSTQPMQFHRHHNGDVHFRVRGLPIRLDEDGAVCGIRFNTRCMATPRAGTRDHSALLEATALFTDLIRRPENQLRLVLQPDEILFFDHERTMHGRTAFDPSLAERHLRSCNVDRDALHSRYRILAAEHAPDGKPGHMPQGVVH